jgi:hypothetical protein
MDYYTHQWNTVNSHNVCTRLPITPLNNYYLHMTRKTDAHHDVFRSLLRLNVSLQASEENGHSPECMH